MSVHISGSIAFDRIMSFPGHFEDHLLPDKLHMLNVSFLTDNIEEKRGGTAGNIAYNLCLLGEKPHVYTGVGRDFIGTYQTLLEKMGVVMDGIKIHDHAFTACAYITTDAKGNQITGFSPAAMKSPIDMTKLPEIKSGDIGIVAAGNMDDMRFLPKYFKEKKCPYIFDPGQQVVSLSKENLYECISGSFMLIGNDYEIELICNSTNKTKSELLEVTSYIITTLGENGCQISDKEKSINVEAMKDIKVADPTGAGDAFRAGIIRGLGLGLHMEVAARIANICASFAIENIGTQAHTYDYTTFKTRYECVYGPIPLSEF